jgi:hypothetical protein
MSSQVRLYEAKLDAAYTKKYGAIEEQIKDLKKFARQAAQSDASGEEVRGSRAFQLAIASGTRVCVSRNGYRR